MKKIERLDDCIDDYIYFRGESIILDSGFYVVKESDLDEQERYIAVLESRCENTVKMLKTVLQMLDTKTCL